MSFYSSNDNFALDNNSEKFCSIKNNKIKQDYDYDDTFDMGSEATRDNTLSEVGKVEPVNNTRIKVLKTNKLSNKKNKGNRNNSSTQAKPLRSNLKTNFNECWELNLEIIAKLESENAFIKKTNSELKSELKTLQRQVKIQSSRLSKALGNEGNIPNVLRTLASENKSMQVHLRRKTLQYESSERKVAELENKINSLHSKIQHLQSELSDREVDSTPSKKQYERLQADLAAEKDKNLVLSKQLELLQKSNRQRESLLQEHIKTISKKINEKDEKIQSLNNALLEKTKLLELQNIYSKRIPTNKKLKQSISSMNSHTETSSAISSQTHSHTLLPSLNKSKPSDRDLISSSEREVQLDRKESLTDEVDERKSDNCSIYSDGKASSKFAINDMKTDFKETLVLPKEKEFELPDIDKITYDDHTPSRESANEFKMNGLDLAEKRETDVMFGQKSKISESNIWKDVFGNSFDFPNRTSANGDNEQAKPSFAQGHAGLMAKSASPETSKTPTNKLHLIPSNELAKFQNLEDCEELII